MVLSGTNADSNHTNIVIIGLDGATFDVIDPLINRGLLPNLKYLKENGAYGFLRSTFPPVTGPAWLSMATGKNPGKTGVFDFLVKSGSSYIKTILNSQHFKDNRAYWDYASSVGMRVAIINYPGLYPPYELGGVMISGLGAPSGKPITYPSELMNELEDLIGNYEICVPWANRKYRDKLELFLSDLKRMLEKRIEVSKHIIKKEDWDLFLTVFSAPDLMQHCMWQFWTGDPESHFHREFVEVWRRLDEGIGEILSLVPKDSTIFVVSDHGFGELEGRFLINRWLEQEGWLVRKTGWRSIKDNIINKITIPLRKLLIGTSIRRTLRRQFPAVKIDPTLRIADPNKTKALSGSGLSRTYGGIYVQNYKDEEEYECIRDEIIDSLESKASSRFQINIKCFKREDIYSGGKIGLAPDILLKINDFACSVQTAKMDGEIFQPHDRYMTKTGSHRQEGVFICKGPNINKGELGDNIDIEDICPTILYLLGFPSLDDIDGVTRKELFSVPPKENPELGQSRIKSASDHKEDTQNQSEIEETLRRLRDLGYLD